MIDLPPNLLAENGLRFALQESTTPGLVICAILVVLSCFSWTVMITKIRTVRRAHRANLRFYKAFREAPSPLALLPGIQDYADSPMARVYKATAQEVSRDLIGSTVADENFLMRLQGAGSLNPSQMKAITVSMERSIAECAQKLEGQMPLLATAVSGAPFLGLLGTVWGVMDTFGAVAMANGGTPGLQVMSPGVAAALLTTVVGLLVAIPAMFGYNFLVNSIRGMIVRLDNFGAELLGVIDHLHVSHGRRFDSLPSISAMTGVSGFSPPDPEIEPELPFAGDLAPSRNPPPIIPEDMRPPGIVTREPTQQPGLVQAPEKI